MSAITGTEAKIKFIDYTEKISLNFAKIIECLKGYPSDTAAPARQVKYNKRVLKYYDVIKRLLSKNKAVAVAFFASFTAENGKKIKEHHAYSILRIEENPESKLIYATLRNPHGIRSGETTKEEVINVLESSTKEQRSRAIYSVELNDLVDYLTCLYYQENNKLKKLI